MNRMARSFPNPLQQCPPLCIRMDGHITSLRRTFSGILPANRSFRLCRVASPRIFEKEEEKEQRVQFDTHFDEGRDQYQKYDLLQMCERHTVEWSLQVGPDSQRVQKLRIVIGEWRRWNRLAADGGTLALEYWRATLAATKLHVGRKIDRGPCLPPGCGQRSDSVPSVRDPAAQTQTRLAGRIRSCRGRSAGGPSGRLYKIFRNRLGHALCSDEHCFGGVPLFHTEIDYAESVDGGGELNFSNHLTMTHDRVRVVLRNILLQPDRLNRQGMILSCMPAAYHLHDPS